MIVDHGSLHKKAKLLYAGFMPRRYGAVIGGAHLIVLKLLINHGNSTLDGYNFNLEKKNKKPTFDSFDT